MAREKIFEETQTWPVKKDGEEPALELVEMALPVSNPVPGETYTLTSTIRANTNNIFYLILYRDKGTDNEEIIQEIADLALNNTETDWETDLTVPQDEDEELTLTLEGGYEE